MRTNNAGIKPSLRCLDLSHPLPLTCQMTHLGRAAVPVEGEHPVAEGVAVPPRRAAGNRVNGPGVVQQQL
jgi:hypothetical protein